MSSNKKWHRIYALYHGDNFLCSGTKKELTNFLGLRNPHSIDHYKSKSYYQKRFLPQCNSFLVIYICDEYF